MNTSGDWGREHLEKVADGSSLLLLTTILTFFIFIVMLVAGMLLGGMSATLEPGDSEPLIGIIGLFGGGILLLITGLHIYAFLQFTKRRTGERGFGARRWTRLCFAVTLLANAVPLALVAASFVDLGERVRGSLLIGALATYLIGSVVSIIGATALYISTMLYIRRSGIVIGNGTLEERGKLWSWLGPVLLTVGSIVVVGPIIAMIFKLVMLRQTSTAIRAYLGAALTEAGRTA